MGRTLAGPEEIDSTSDDTMLRRTLLRVQRLPPAVTEAVEVAGARAQPVR